MFREKFSCSVLVMIAFLSGCNASSESTVPSTSKPVSPASYDSGDSGKQSEVKEEAASRSVPLADDQLVEGNWVDLQKLVAEQKGKVVVLDVWSTACEPCMKEFPHLIALQNRFPDDVVAISFDIDYAGIKKKPVTYYRERVLKFLGSQAESRALHRMCTTPADELFTEINLDSIPAVYVYGRNGNLAQRFDSSNSQGEGVSYEKQVIPFVVDRVKEKE